MQFNVPFEVDLSAGCQAVAAHFTVEVCADNEDEYEIDSIIFDGLVITCDIAPVDQIQVTADRPIPNGVWALWLKTRLASDKHVRQTLNQAVADKCERERIYAHD